LCVAAITPSKAFDADIVVVGAEPRPLIPPGIYEAVCVDYKLHWLGKVPKLVLVFEVLVDDAKSEYGRRRIRLGHFCNVQALGGGRFRAPRNGLYAREWMLVANRRITRQDRLSPSIFVRVLVSVEVVTVERDREHRPLPHHARYSKVARILEHKAGGGRE
jgi:hypothetical protein